MLEIQSAKEIRGTVQLPANPDLYALVLNACAVTSRQAVISPLPHAPIRAMWDTTFAPLLSFTFRETEMSVTPLAEPQSVVRLPWNKSPHGTFMLFSLLALGKTVIIPPVAAPTLEWWKAMAGSRGLTLEIAEQNSELTLQAHPDQTQSTQAPQCEPDELEVYLGIAFGMGSTLTADVDFLYASPVRQLLTLFECKFSVKNTSRDRNSDPLARRIQRLKAKTRKDRAAQQTFEINLGCAEPSQETVFVALPGDNVLCSAFIAAKSIIQRGSLVIENAPLEAWATPCLQFVRKMGCTPGTQVQSQTAFGEQGLLQLQRFELTGRKSECVPLFQHRFHVATMSVIALFAQGESVFRNLERLRDEDPDGIDELTACLKSAGAHQGEMPDGIVVKGGRQHDGFDLSQEIPAHVAVAFCMAGLKSMGITTINDSDLCARWPDFKSVLDSVCIYRS